jgi:carbamate kinase
MVFGCLLSDAVGQRRGNGRCGTLVESRPAEAADIGTVTVDEMRSYAADGHFASGSMGPKVDAVCRFVEAGGGRAVITDLVHLGDAVRGDAGTVVVPAT